MFELFDQFIYIAILMFGAYVTLYFKSRSYSGILLIACSILSNILLFSVVLDPFIFITLPITAVLLLADFVEDFKSGIVSRKHQLGMLIAVAIIIYDLIFVISVSNFNLVDSYNLFTVGSVIGTITGFYLVIYPFKEMMHEREQNLQTIYEQENIAIGNDQKQITEADLDSDPNLLDVIEGDLQVNSNQAHNPSKESSYQSPPRPELNRKLFGIDIMYLAVGGLIVLLLIGSIVYDLVTRTVLDMEDYVFVTVEPDSFEEAKVGYYASFEHFDENNFYDDLIATGQQYGLTEKQIETYTPVYTSATAEMFKKLDLEVALDKSTASNGDIVTTNITYNEKYAIKNNIKLKNTNFETEISTIPSYLTETVNKNTEKDLIAQATTAIQASKYSDKYDLARQPVCQQQIVDERLYLDCSYDGQNGGILGRQETTITFRLTPYQRADQYYLLDQIEIID